MTSTDTKSQGQPSRCSNKHQHKAATNHSYSKALSTAGEVIDPVCGMTVDPHTAQHRTLHEGHPFYFCSAGCKTKFESSPAKYLENLVTPPVIEGAIYTCPMHSGYPPGWPRILPDMRHGTRTGNSEF